MESPIHSSYTLTFYFLPVDGYLINGHPQLMGYVQDLNVKCPTYRHTHNDNTDYRLVYIVGIIYYMHTCNRFQLHSYKWQF